MPKKRKVKKSVEAPELPTVKKSSVRSKQLGIQVMAEEVESGVKKMHSSVRKLMNDVAGQAAENDAAAKKMGEGIKKFEADIQVQVKENEAAAKEMESAVKKINDSIKLLQGSINRKIGEFKRYTKEFYFGV